MYIKIKRLMDIVITSIGMVILLPVYIVIILGIKLDSKGPILFKQKRVGKDKAHFMILKFRTMRIDTPKDTPTHLLQNPDQWITTIGRFLRKSSLDELPQLINVLKGEMSLVGPRPALWNQYDLIEQRDHFGVNDILPGVTGWAQINGRDELPIKEKVKYDHEYLEKLGFWFDLKILFLTAFSVISKKGIKEGA